MTGKERKMCVNAAWDMQWLTATISTTLVLLLLGLTLFFACTARNLAAYVREHVRFSIVLDEGVTDRDASRLRRELEKEPFVKEVEYISKEQALQEYVDEMGADPRDFVGYNPLSASMEVRLRAEYVRADSLERIGGLLGQRAQVKEVAYREDLLEALNRNVGRVGAVLLALAALLLLVSFALISNTVRLFVYARRFLIHTMKLVGASWSFIRRPLLGRFFWTGVLAAAMADGLLWAAAGWLVTYEPALVQVVTPEALLAVSGAVLAGGVLVTTSCAWMAVNRYLRMKAGALYRI